MRLPKFWQKIGCQKSTLAEFCQKWFWLPKVLVSVQKPQVPACQLPKMVLAVKKKVSSDHCQLSTLAIDLFFCLTWATHVVEGEARQKKHAKHG